jgi:hypothetical protein
MQRTPKGRGSRAGEASKVRVWLHAACILLRGCAGTEPQACILKQTNDEAPLTASRIEHKSLPGVSVEFESFLGVAGVGASPHDMTLRPPEGWASGVENKI